MQEEILRCFCALRDLSAEEAVAYTFYLEDGAAWVMRALRPGVDFAQSGPRLARCAAAVANYLAALAEAGGLGAAELAVGDVTFKPNAEKAVSQAQKMCEMTLAGCRDLLKDPTGAVFHMV